MTESNRLIADSSDAGSVSLNELIEKVARVIYTERNGKWDYREYRSDPRIAEAYRKDAKAAIAAMGDAGKADSGLSVPPSPTTHEKSDSKNESSKKSDNNRLASCEISDALIDASADYMWKKMQRGETGFSKAMLRIEIKYIINKLRTSEPVSINLVKAIWNAGADCMNQWETLSDDEKQAMCETAGVKWKE